VIRALIREHFDEWEYNGHWGGDSLYGLFQRENPILAYDASWPASDIEDAVLPALQDGYESASMPISLFAGYYDGHPNMPLQAMNHGEEYRYEVLSRKIKTANAFLLEDEAKELLVPHLNSVRRRLPAGSEIFRARIGYVDSRFQVFARPEDPWSYFPFEAAKLGAPPPILASAGRMNRGGVSFFYGASDPDTAVSEVRPHPGHVVSVGSFRTVRELVIADFNELPIQDFSSSDASLDDYWALLCIGRLFTAPVTPEERSNYVLSQLFADTLRQLGLDGVCFDSSVGRGKNFTLFEPQSVEYVPGSSNAIRVTNVSYSTKALRTAERLE
jgi:hypothetical protein